MGYEQSYVSALEVGLKGPPTQEFIDRLINVLPLSPTEQQEVLAAAEASQRKLILDADTPQDVYWLLKEFREAVQQLRPVHVRMIRDVLSLSGVEKDGFTDPTRRLKRRKKEEIRM